VRKTTLFQSFGGRLRRQLLERLRPRVEMPAPAAWRVVGVVLVLALCAGEVKFGPPALVEAYLESTLEAFTEALM
jgi:hypothetical protein